MNWFQFECIRLLTTKCACDSNIMKSLMAFGSASVQGLAPMNVSSHLLRDERCCSRKLILPHLSIWIIYLSCIWKYTTNTYIKCNTYNIAHHQFAHGKPVSKISIKINTNAGKEHIKHPWSVFPPQSITSVTVFIPEIMFLNVSVKYHLICTLWKNLGIILIISTHTFLHTHQD